MRRLLMSVLGGVLVTSALAPLPAAAETTAVSVDARTSTRLVTLAASSTDRIAGQRLVLGGKVRTERGVRRRVQLHAQVHGEWDVVASTRTNSKGRYRFVLTSPNPTGAPVGLGFRAEAVGTANPKLRKAWRRPSRSATTRITFRNNPAITLPSYALADPAACDSGTAGVMARTAACVAAVEAQLAERTWLDVRLLERRERDVDLTLQLAVQLQALTMPDQQSAHLQVLLPHASAAFPESAVPAGKEAFEMTLLALLLIGFGIQEELEEIDPGAGNATAWQPAWTEHFIVRDLGQVVVSGDTATTPERTFDSGGAGSGAVTLGGSWEYVGGRWYPVLDAAATIDDLR